MKKISCVLLTIIAVLAFCGTAYASDISAFSYNDGVDSAIEGSVTATTYVYSSFTVELPLTMDASQSGTISVSNANIEAGKTIRVYATNLDEDGTFPLYNDRNSEFVRYAKIQRGENAPFATYTDPLIASFTSDQIAAGDTIAQFLLMLVGSTNGLAAGSYSGTLCYRIVME